MPLPYSNTVEGISQGTTVTTINSGGASGDAWSNMNIDAGAAIISDNAHVAAGTQAVKLTIAAVPGAVSRFGWDVTGTTDIYGRTYLYRTANPSGAGQLVILSDLSGTGACGYLDISTGGQIRIWDSLGANLGTMATPIELDALNRIEFRIKNDAGAAGIVHAKLFSGHSTTLVDEVSSSGGTTRASMTHLYFGEMNASDANGVIWFDDLNVNTTGFPGPSVVATSALPQAARVRYF